jgi:hypothetical protein
MIKKILRISLITILSIMAIVSIILVVNKTFIKNYYRIKNEKELVNIPVPRFSYLIDRKKDSAKFYTLRSPKKIQIALNNYVENLQSCYDESYFYDKNTNITIKRYYVEDSFPFNKIYLEYILGNYCENEYVLDDNWLKDIKDKAKIQEIDITKCNLKDNNVKCDTKTLTDNDINGLLKDILPDDAIRIDYKNNFGIDPTKDYYSIEAYYVVGKFGYTLSIFKYNDYLAFKIIDINDHQKNAVYEINKDVNSIFQDVYNKY